MVAGTGADLIHEIGPLVGKGRIARVRVHAARALSRAKGALEKDLPQAKATFDKMAPYIPSLGRLLYVELKEKLPGPKDAWQSLMRRAVPKAEEAEVPSSHEYIPATPTAGEDADQVRLQVVN